MRFAFWASLIAKPQAPLALQLPEHTNLLLEVFDDVLLLSVDPTSQANQDESSDPHRKSLAERQPLHSSEASWH
ncbi:hypothetical protein [Luteolibacter soli]